MHAHDHDVSRNNLWQGVVWNAMLAMVEFAVFLLTNSVTVGFASLHDAGDAVTSLMAYYMEGWAKKRPVWSHVSAFITSCVVIGSCVCMLVGAIGRLFVPQVVESHNIWILAIFSFTVNWYLARTLGHGHSLNEQSQGNHYQEDALGSVAMFAVWLCSGFVDAFVADPIATILIAIYIAYRAFVVLFTVVVHILATRTCRCLSCKKVTATQTEEVCVGECDRLQTRTCTNCSTVCIRKRFTSDKVWTTWRLK